MKKAKKMLVKRLLIWRKICSVNSGDLSWQGIV